VNRGTDAAQAARDRSIRKLGGTAIKRALIASILLTGLAGPVSTAAAGDFNVTIGGITTTSGGSTRVPGSGSTQVPTRQIDKPQVGSFSVPDTSSSNPRTDIPSTGGNSLAPSPDTKSSQGSGTVSSGNTGLGGSFSGGGTLSQPSSQFCSTNSVTVGETTQGRTHCSNSVNGTLKP
jgi:hypothetical protein